MVQGAWQHPLLRERCYLSARGRPRAGWSGLLSLILLLVLWLDILKSLESSLLQEFLLVFFELQDDLGSSGEGLGALGVDGEGTASIGLPSVPST